jgi:uncharacterized membrane protein
MTTPNWTKHLKTVSKYLLASLMLGAGTMHFVQTDFFTRIMPPYLPWHRELVYISGICEAVLGLLLLVPRISRFAAWGIIALLIAVFPANIYLCQHLELLPTSLTAHFLRPPHQGVFCRQLIEELLIVAKISKCGRNKSQLIREHKAVNLNRTQISPEALAQPCLSVTTH